MVKLADLKNPAWELHKSQYEETNQLPLMYSPEPIMLIIAAYLLFVLKLGPDFMKNRDAFKLKYTLILYNSVQILYSLYLVQYHFKSLLHTGLAPKTCYMNDHSSRQKVLFGIWIYFAAKLSELLDTVFIVLRKKTNQVTFLHLYHHTIMVVGTWACLKYWPSHNLFFIGFLNSLVHVFMYTYYALAALGPSMEKYLTWKKYMTKFQLVQFVSIIVQYVIGLKYSDCPPPQGAATFVACNTSFILLLFLNFYRQNYSMKGKKICILS